MLVSGLARAGTYAERFKNYHWKDEYGKPVSAYRVTRARRGLAYFFGFCAYAFLFIVPTPDIIFDQDRRLQQKEERHRRSILHSAEVTLQNKQRYQNKLLDDSSSLDEFSSGATHTVSLHEW